MLSGQPIIVLKEGTRRESGRDAQTNNINAAIAIGNAVRSTLGPKGMDKMLVDSMGDVTITNDGVTILKNLDVEHPAAKMLVEVAKTMDQQCGDGTTTSVVLAGELLKQALDLLGQNIHPTVITRGYALASQKAVEILEKNAMPITVNDEEMLRKVAETALASKSASAYKEKLSEISVKAVKLITEELPDGNRVADIDNILVVKKQGGAVADTALIDGIILDKERVHEGMPRVVENAKIALLDAALEVKKTEVDARISITSPDQLQGFLQQEENMLREMVDKVKASGANVLICQKGIDDVAQHFLAKAGIYAVRRAKKSDMEKLAKACGGRIVSALDDLSAEDLGSAGHVEERKIGEDKLTFVTGCPNAKAVSILIRGGTEHVVDEIERAMRDALSVVARAVEDGKVSIGGGAAAMEIALELRRYAPSVGGREQLAIESFASALETVPKTLAENAGMDQIDVLLRLRKAHSEGKKNYGVNVLEGDVADLFEKNVFEPLKVPKETIRSSTEAAVMILRIDDVIAGKGTRAPAGPPGGGYGGPEAGMME
ncbi:MAG: thermosome subunit beta [Candidatus Thermoplasmatota archaeon]|nr:thermosome subunit beta [Candidatus Thermoplasmatota archaeon]